MPTAMTPGRGAEEYGRAIRSHVRGLWSGATLPAAFIVGMSDTIERGLTRAWNEGAASVGIAAGELTPAEVQQRTRLIFSEQLRVPSFGDFIVANDKAHGGKLAPLLVRAALWQNRYLDAVNRARVAASSDPKLVWVLGQTKEHCPTCLKLTGKVKRSSTWEAAGIQPKNYPNPMLQCGGWNCGCELPPAPPGARCSPGPLPKCP